MLLVVDYHCVLSLLARAAPPVSCRSELSVCRCYSATEESSFPKLCI